MLFPILLVSTAVLIVILSLAVFHSHVYLVIQRQGEVSSLRSFGRGLLLILMALLVYNVWVATLAESDDFAPQLATGLTILLGVCVAIWLLCAWRTMKPLRALSKRARGITIMSSSNSK